MLSKIYRTFCVFELLRFIDEQREPCSEKKLKIEAPRFPDPCFLLPCLHGLKNEGLVAQWRDKDCFAYYALTERGKRIVESYRKVCTINASVYPGSGT